MQSQRDGTAGFILQREDLQAELQALESKILAKVLEDRRLSAQDAQARIGVALRQGGATGVTEEVSAGLSPRVMMVTAGVGSGCVSHCVCTGQVTCAWQTAELWGQPLQLGHGSWAHVSPGKSILGTRPFLLCHQPPLGCTPALEGVASGYIHSPARLLLA